MKELSHSHPRSSAFIRGFLSRLPAVFGRVICWRGSRRRQQAALTFDDGPHPEFTPRVLEILAGAGARATFFLDGERVERFPDLARRIRDAGHEIGNHGYAHATRALTDGALRCAVALEAAGLRTRLYRPPRGTVRIGDLMRLALRGYRTVLWSFDTHDSMRHEGKWREGAPDYGRIGSGDIVLMHDDNPVCIAELPVVLGVLESEGITATAVSGLR